MLDIKYIRENKEKVEKAAHDKHVKVDIAHVLQIEDKRKELQIMTQQLQEERNLLTSAIQGKPSDEQIAKGKEIRERLSREEDALKAVQDELRREMYKVPTVPAEDTPSGEDESGNVVVSQSGEIPSFEFTPLDHVALAQKLDLIDFERGTKVSGFRGYYLKNDAVSLVMGLMMYTMEKLIAKGFQPMLPPTLVNEFALAGSGYFKSGEYDADTDEIYQIASHDKEATGETSKDKKFLVGTAEPSLLAYYARETLKESQLPMKLAGFSQCYRSEIGSYGKDTKGLYRVHEFMKVEQVVLAPADVDVADQLQQEMLAISKELHEDLGLPHRVLRICAGDLGSGKYKQFDLEAWLPGSNRWAETGSASNFLDWQSRRLDVRYVTENGEKKYVYMLNNTAMPSPRPLIAILENYQQADGSIRVPKVLQKWVGKEVIKTK